MKGSNDVVKISEPLILSMPSLKKCLQTFKHNEIENGECFMAPFYGWGSTASRLEPLRGGSFESLKPSGFEHGTSGL